LVVIGSGPAGLTAGLYGHRAGLEVLIIGGQDPGGQVMRHHNIENYPGFPGGVTGPELMARWLRQVIEEIGSAPEPECVTQVNFSNPIKLLSVGEKTIRSRSVIVATGCKSRRMLVPGEDEFYGKGVFFCATCDGPMLRTMSNRNAVVVGGGDSAFHTAEALLPHADSVTIIMRGSKPKAQRVLTRRLEQNPKTRIIADRSVIAVKGETSVNQLVLRNVHNGEIELFPVNAVFVGIGQAPATEFLEGKLEQTPEGFLVTDRELCTSTAGVFGAGDIRDTPLRQIVTAASDGAVAAGSATRYVRTM
ncbi:MAG: NAD(P)/FAD-dependent oxidoreductase, partial [Desulfomonilaceae bacterium]